MLRDWRKYLDICAKKWSNLNLNNREWGWMSGIKCEDEESLNQEDLLATQIKMQRVTIRHFKPILDEGIREIENKVSLKPQHKKEGVPSRQFPSKKKEPIQAAKPKVVKAVRQREEILFKKNGLPLSKADDRKLNKQFPRHIWNNCPDLQSCIPEQCWRALKSGKCDRFGETLWRCTTCMLRLKTLVCIRCKKPGIQCDCGVDEEVLPRAKTALEEALQSYKVEHKIESVTELLSLMAGVVDPTKCSCIYDSRTHTWVEKGFAPAPRAKFEWECLEKGTVGTTSFILDSGSQLNMLKFTEAMRLGVNVEELSRIYLRVNGIPDLIQDIEKIRPPGWKTIPGKKNYKKQALASSYLTRCEETTIFGKEQGEYLCECPRREALLEGEQATQEHETKMQVIEKMIGNLKTWEQEGNTKEEIKELVKGEIIGRGEVRNNRTCATKWSTTIMDKPTTFCAKKQRGLQAGCTF